MVFRIADVADVKDADSTQALFADAGVYALHATVEPAFKPFAADKEEVTVYRHITLGGRTQKVDHQLRRGGIGDIPNQRIRCSYPG